MGILQIEFSSCGWGFCGGLFPEVRLGYMRLIWADADFATALQKLRDALGASTVALRLAAQERHRDHVEIAEQAERIFDLTELAERQANHIAQLELGLSDREHISSLAAELMQ